jgi:D-alanyl-lipoteichoic acid acyltransferase DltB (MBOAT superfamily)
VLFNSIQYAGFLALVIVLYWCAPHQYRRWILLISSYFFYATWDWRFAVLLAASTLIDFFIGRTLGWVQHTGQRKALLIMSVGTNLGVLALFKYFNFFIGSFEGLVETFGFNFPKASLAVIVPVGLSFYVFQAISYTVDIYRRDIKPCPSLLTFAAYLAYFPHLLAGPIVRARRLIPQFDNLPLRPNGIQVAEGFELILIGLFQKVAIADALSPVTDSVFASFGQGRTGSGGSWLALWIATLSSVIQFILDFAGYSNIARGSSKLMGIELPYNFRQPLTRSRNFRDFWRREHMTLMGWFRDYVYRPLHRKHHGRWAAAAVLVFVFALSGLWHGAGWIWISWGLLIGAALVVEMELTRWWEQRRPPAARAGPPARGNPPAADGAPAKGVAQGTSTKPAPTPAAAATRSRVPTWLPLGPIYVFILMAFGVAWVRAGSVPEALRLYGDLLWPDSFSVTPDHLFLFLYALTALILVDRREHQMELLEGKPDPPTNLRIVGWSVMIVLITVFSGAPPQPFVYFQF